MPDNNNPQITAKQLRELAESVSISLKTAAPCHYLIFRFCSVARLNR